MQYSSFKHKALDLKGSKGLVYTAFSKHYFYYRMHISKYVLEKSKVPLNPFLLFDYFLLDSVDRETVRDANNSLVIRADELWVFGPVSNGVLAEILLGKKLNKTIKSFKIASSSQIIPILLKDIEMEEDVKEFKSLIVNISEGQT